MRKLLAITSLLAIVFGLLMVGGGLWGMMFIYKSVAQEKITTPDDASIPGAPVLGPLTLKAQADVIRFHSLRTANGMTYAELPRQVAQMDTSGNQVLGSDGKPVMIANPARTNWITATALTAALNLGILSYGVSALVAFLGLSFIWSGIVFYALSKRY